MPTVKDVMGRLAINPNTVLKACRELEHQGLIAPRPGLGDESIEALFLNTFRASGQEDVA